MITAIDDLMSYQKKVLVDVSNTPEIEFLPDGAPVLELVEKSIGGDSLASRTRKRASFYRSNKVLDAKRDITSKLKVKLNQ